MVELELLRSIRPTWLQRATNSLAKGVGVREDFRDQLDHFMGLLEQSLITGDYGWMDSILSLWATSLPETDLETGQSHLTTLIKELLLLSYNVCQEQLSPEQAMTLINVLLPCFTYAFEKSAQFEIEARISHLSSQLQSIQTALEKLDRSKSDFIAVAAHELKTPLTLVEGYAAMLREYYEHNNSDPTVAKTHIDGIFNGAHRLRGIIDDIIDVSLIDNNLMILNFQPTWLNRIFTVLGNELAGSVKERQQLLEICAFPGSDELLFADPERLLQLFRNLLVNAIKFTPDGGKIRIDGRRLPGFIEVMIIDTGIGIAMEDQATIFEKFARLGNVSLHSSGKTKFKGGGPGLGLHIAKGIIEAHGGAVWVESRGHDEQLLPGTTFHILLPWRTEPPDERMVKIFSPLIKKQTTEEEPA
ncbi:MAG: HAMP domain-containing histidine kinase [Chloroflexi bacterium]|nr:HAMP domain-containing histidine kinase [Chloroflexota bacterium]